MLTPQQDSIISSLSIQAVRQGQSFWFRVVSNSMNPIVCIDDQVRIEPAKANEILPGEIAAFETPKGLVVHRIVRCKQRGTAIRLLQMADVELHASWIEEPVVIGRVVAARRGGLQIDLQHPVAQLCGTVTAHLRYRLYTWRKWRPLRGVLHKSSRLAVQINYWCIRSSCTSPVSDPTSWENLH